MRERRASASKERKKGMPASPKGGATSAASGAGLHHRHYSPEPASHAAGSSHRADALSGALGRVADVSARFGGMSPAVRFIAGVVTLSAVLASVTVAAGGVSSASMAA